MNISFPNYHDAEPATDFDRQTLAFVQEWFSETETVQIQTSGSTGIPKILEIEKDRMRHSARMTCRFLGLQTGDSALLCLPVAYISGKMMVVRAIEQQLKLMVSEPSVRPLQHLAETVDFCALTPLQVEHSLDKLNLIRNIIIGGAV
ncbi:MAG TPA: AMP-dependent synthetase, partial [Chryseobacterium sp.]|nr:AMP-dependent synthetase [Chryseobacterium sp.]